MTMTSAREAEKRSEHTETPWHWDSGALVAANGDLIIWPQNVPGDAASWLSWLGSFGLHAELHAEANAAHIVKCVNAHDDLVAALRAVADEVLDVRSASYLREPVLAKVLAAIAKAEATK